MSNHHEYLVRENETTKWQQVEVKNERVQMK